MAGIGSEVSSKELLEAQTHLWNHIFSFMNSSSLKTAVELGIPDAVHKHGRPITLTELSAALSIPACRVDNLRRLMALLVHNGFFAQTTSANDETVYSLTINSSLLVKEKGFSQTPVIEALLGQHLLEPWQYLTPWIKSEQPSSAFEMCHGSNIWDAMGNMPELWNKLRETMDSDSASVAKVIIEKCADQLQGVKSLVEVAGNKGTVSLAIAKAFPHIKCTLLELPHVIDAIEKSDLIEYVGGDMFVNIPSADVLILKWVLMTRSDGECVKILKRCKESIPTKENGGKAIIIEKVMGTSPDGTHPKLSDVQLYFDMHIMVQLTGKQRTEAEWKKLFDEAGFKEYKIIPALGMRCIIEIYH